MRSNKCGRPLFVLLGTMLLLGTLASPGEAQPATAVCNVEGVTVVVAASGQCNGAPCTGIVVLVAASDSCNPASE